MIMWSPRSRVIGLRKRRRQIAAGEPAEVRVVVDARHEQAEDDAACTMIDIAICLTTLLPFRP